VRLGLEVGGGAVMQCGGGHAASVVGGRWGTGGARGGGLPSGGGGSHREEEDIGVMSKKKLLMKSIKDEDCQRRQGCAIHLSRSRRGWHAERRTSCCVISIEAERTAPRWSSPELVWEAVSGWDSKQNFRGNGGEVTGIN
jgi:hypothetical protein